ncbi:DUF2062 domain-containing protein [Myroides odoratus]|uniref:DUF2062 domain-containing protein n=1 Tax=Myroides odoratus TaxID=256 RepID=UPI00333FC85D
MTTQNPATYTTKLKEWGICILIPTYNNHKTLQRVLDGVLAYTTDVIVVNDGSTAETALILEAYQHQITIIHLPVNRGKGNALQIGFEHAKALGFSYAITIDSDGQHYPSDIPVFVEALEEAKNKELLLIGSRNMNQDGVPKKSSFGNKFSNFWFWFETGISLSDTQSGYRLYPLNKLANKFFTRKFEFEIEVIVRAAWNNVEVKNVPVQVLYDSSERVSHFRPFKDFTRISILNTVLVCITLLYIIPRNFLRSFKKKSFKAFITEDILGSNDTASVKALSIGLGTFIGLSPLWGLQTFLAIFLAITFRLNKVLAFAFSNVSIPPMIPLIVYASLQLGYYMVPQGSPHILISEYSFASISEHLWQYILGSFALAMMASFCLGSISFFLISIAQKQKK